jgi:hypothetical protein
MARTVAAVSTSARLVVCMAIVERKRALEAGSKKSVFLWSSVAAATAGIVAVVAISAWKARTMSSTTLGTRVRDVQDVLLDCETKIHEIQIQIAEILPVAIPHITTS